MEIPTEVPGETIEINEADTVVRTLIRILDEDEEISEQALAFLGLIRILDEDEEISENTLSLLGILQVLNETEEISEADTVARDLVRFAESLQTTTPNGGS